MAATPRRRTSTPTPWSSATNQSTSGSYPVRDLRTLRAPAQASPVTARASTVAPVPSRGGRVPSVRVACLDRLLCDDRTEPLLWDDRTEPLDCEDSSDP